MQWCNGVLAALLIAAPAWAGTGKVWVAPFAEANQTQQKQQQPDWINRALHQSVQDDLSAIKSVTVMTAAVAAAAPADAEYIVSATIQRVNGELRVTGRVEDTSTKQIMGGFKATGAERDLFAIEDSIAQQLRAIIAPQSAAPAPAQPTTVASANPFAPPQPAYEGSELQRSLDERDYLRRLQERNALRYQPVPDYSYQQPVYPVDYGYNNFNNFPYGTYGGWWGGGSVIVVNGQNQCRTDYKRSNCDFVANPSCPPTQSLAVSGNGQRIRQVGSWGGRAPSVMVNTPTFSPQLTPTRSPQLVPTRSPQLVPTRSPQMIQTRGPQLVQTRGPQNVPGPAIRR